MIDQQLPLPYQYVVLRFVPRVEREEFLNLGVVVFCEAAKFLACSSVVDPARLAAFAPDADVAAVCDVLDFVGWVCAGDERAGAAGRGSLSTRFGFLKAPRSTVVQPGPVHGGVSSDPARELDRLSRSLAG